jgi:copper chaperone CopZ
MVKNIRIALALAFARQSYARLKVPSGTVFLYVCTGRCSQRALKSRCIQSYKSVCSTAFASIIFDGIPKARRVFNFQRSQMVSSEPEAGNHALPIHRFNSSQPHDEQILQRLREHLEQIPGVRSVSIHPQTEMVYVVCNSPEVTADLIFAAIDQTRHMTHQINRDFKMFPRG